MPVAIYTRVSTGSQTTENQLRERDAVAARQGRQVVARFTDEGSSSAESRDQRPGFEQRSWQVHPLRAIARHQHAR